MAALTVRCPVCDEIVPAATELARSVGSATVTITVDEFVPHMLTHYEPPRDDELRLT